MAMKLTKRKGFNFFRSYFDVYNELTDKEKVMFIDALLDRQFLGIKPKNLTGNARFAYISQTNSIDSQVKGYEDKTGIILTPTEPPTDGGSVPPAVQVEGKEKGQEEVQVKDTRPRILDLPFESLDFWNAWTEWEQYKKEKKQKLTESTAKKQLKFLAGRPEKIAILIIEQSITQGWAGLFDLKSQTNGTGFNKKQQQTDELIISHAKRWGNNSTQGT
jgi:hypothetical protein